MNHDAFTSDANRELHAIRYALLRCRRRIRRWLGTHRRGCYCQFCTDPMAPRYVGGKLTEDLRAMAWCIEHVTQFIQCELPDVLRAERLQNDPAYRKRLADRLAMSDLDAAPDDDQEPDPPTIVGPKP